ncbi:LuxR C-terminal-related transcriptional regulator [Variovorax boronicumulans]|uniref:LuxR C-terminal-related transcriptional regulator n=1 Tax=Variovorax boronicumulans TaxID=436515 RepID=UPI0027D7B224|nr:LuxR C-terminal-related transcriptional regulator [Variovorax boronicumulans]
MTRADTELALKATAPRASDKLLVRDRLRSDSAQLSARSIIVLQASGGFGKTSLLLQWRREWLRRGAVVAWLMLDERDDATRFAQGIGVAMRLAIGGAASASAFTRSALTVQDSMERLTEWLALVAAMAAEVVLVLDDVHTLPDATVREAMAYLVHNAPANLTLVLATRRRLALPLSHMRARGQYAEVNADMLRLRLEEAIAVLVERFGTRIDTDTCVRLHELSEGWPLGLQLAISGIDERADVSEAVARLTTLHSNVNHHFVGELIEHLPPALADFLTRISIADMVNPALCFALTNAADATAMLDQLRASTPIFVDVPDSDWVRVHPLVREFLRARVQTWPFEVQRDLHFRAASWLADNGLHEEAVRHAFATGEPQWAYDLTERCLRQIIASGHLATVLDWIERLPLAEIERRPWMKLGAGWALVSGNRHRDAAALAGPLLEDESAPISWRLEAAAIVSAAGYHADQFDSAAELQATWRAVPQSEKLKRFAVINRTALSYLYAGRPDLLRYHHAQTAHALGPQEMDALSGLGAWEIGMSYWWEGQAELARATLRAASARADAEIGRRTHLATMLATTLAAVLWDCDAPAEAAIVLANRLDVVERSMAVDPMCMGYVTAARIAEWEGHEGRAFDLLNQLCVVGEARELKRVCVTSLAEQIRMHSRRGHAHTCRTLVERLETICPIASLSESGLWGPLCKLQLSMAHAYAAIGQEDYASARKLLTVAARLAAHLRRGRDDIEIKLLQAFSSRQLNESDTILLAEATSLAHAGGLKRIVRDTYFDRMQPARHHTDHVLEHRSIDESSVAPVIAQGGNDTARVLPSSLLTPKERDVLQLLARSLSNKEIARALDIGSETAKWHLKNLFDKLGASSRKHVVSRARMLGILEVSDFKSYGPVARTQRM